MNQVKTLKHSRMKRRKIDVKSIFSPVMVHMAFFFFLMYPNYFCSNWIAFVMKIRLFSAFMSVGNESGESCRLCEILACMYVISSDTKM